MPRVDAWDVARYQKVIDEAAIPHVPLMTCKASEGATYKDATRPNWIRIFRTHADMIGMYHWIRSDSPLDAQVANLAECYRQEGALPAPGQLAPGWIVQLDWERTYNNVNGQRVLVRDMTVAEIEQWHEIADATFGPGRVVTYASDWVPGFYEWRKRNPGKPLWYANYRLVDDAIGGLQESARYDACLWQWSSQKVVPGVDTISRPGIDVSEILKPDQLSQAAALDATPAPTPQPQPEDDMLELRPNAEPRVNAYGGTEAAGGMIFAIGDFKRNISDGERKERFAGVPLGTALSNAVLDTIPDAVVSSAPTPAPAPGRNISLHIPSVPGDATGTLS